MSSKKQELEWLHSDLLVVRGDNLRRWGCFRPYEEIKDQLIQLPSGDNIRLNFISHRWVSSIQPDPYNTQYSLLTVRSIPSDEFYWYDYSCVPQNSFDEKDKAYISSILNNIDVIIRNSKIVTLREIDDEYFSRGWCYHEWFTAQFLGGKGRICFSPKAIGKTKYSSIERQIEEAKSKSDQMFRGDYRLLDSLSFTKENDRLIVTKLTRLGIEKCQRKISSTSLEFIMATIYELNKPYKIEFNLTTDDIYQRFPSVIGFIDAWVSILREVEPVSERLAMFFHRSHWDSLVNISRPIANSLLSLEYNTKMKEVETSAINKKLKSVYDLCQMKTPEPRFVITAFLCFFLMGYKVINVQE